MQLVLVTHRSRTAFEIGHVGIVIGNDEGTFELTCIPCIDTEIGTQFHRTAHTFGDVDKRAVAEYGTIQGRKEIILIRYDGTQILTHQVWMLLDGLADRAEDDTLLTQFLLEGGLHTDGVHNGIDGGIATQCQTLLKRNTQLIEGLFQFRVNLTVALRLLSQRIGIIGNGLIVDRGYMHMAPCRLLLLLPIAKCLQTEVEHPFRLTFLLGDKSDNVLIQSYRYNLCMYISREAELILLFGYLTHILILVFHSIICI